MSIYYGYCWLKRYEADAALPEEALENASAEHLQPLGVKMPQGDLHQDDPLRAVEHSKP